jgi:hypothetical protein
LSPLVCSFGGWMSRLADLSVAQWVYVHGSMNRSVSG